MPVKASIGQSLLPKTSKANIARLFAKGWSIKRIARRLGHDPKAVKRYLSFRGLIQPTVPDERYLFDPMIRPDGDPTPAAIAKACEEIRRGWSEAQRKRALAVQETGWICPGATDHRERKVG